MVIRYDKFRFILALAFLGIQCNSDKGLGKSACPDINETQYLAFQLFVSGTTEPSDDYQGLGPFISQAHEMVPASPISGPAPTRLQVLS